MSSGSGLNGSRLTPTTFVRAIDHGRRINERWNGSLRQSATRALESACFQADLQLVDGARAHGDLDKVDAIDGAPADEPEALHEYAVLVGADDRAALDERKVVVGDAGRADTQRQGHGAAPHQAGGEQNRRQEAR